MSSDSQFDPDEVDRLIQSDEVLQIAVRGIDFEQAYVTPAIEYLLTMADLEANGYLGALLDTDPGDRGMVASLQAKVIALRGLRTWLKTAIERGESAAQELKEREYVD